MPALNLLKYLLAQLGDNVCMPCITILGIVDDWLVIFKNNINKVIQQFKLVKYYFPWQIVSNSAENKFSASQNNENNQIISI